MAITVKHKFVSAIPDAGDTSVVQPSNWNDDHQLTGTVPVANGGTGAANADDALTNLLPSQTGNSGKVLSTDGTVTSWISSGGTGTVTSVSGTGTVNGITLTGTVTSSGSLTLGGTLGSIGNSQLINSSITFGSTAASLGSTVSALNGVSVGATTASTGAFTYLSTSGSTSVTPTLSFNGSNCPIASGSTIANSYLQFILQNKSGTAGASTNYVLSNDLGTDSSYYGEFGMNSSVYSSGTPADFFSLNNGIYFSGHDGDLTIGSGNGFKTYFAWGTTGQSAHVINASGAIGLNTNITGTSNFGTSGQVLTSAGSSATPTWTTPATGTVTSITAGTGLSGGTITSTGTIAIDSTVATLTGTQTLTNKRINLRVQSQTSTSTLAINSDSYDQSVLTAQAAALSISAPTGTPVNGQKLTIRIKDNGSAQTISWTTTSGGFRIVGVTLPTTTVASKVVYIGAVYNSDETFWDVVSVAQQA